jgi:hypothetical protein
MSSKPVPTSTKPQPKKFSDLKNELKDEKYWAALTNDGTENVTVDMPRGSRGLPVYGPV